MWDKTIIETKSTAEDMDDFFSFLKGLLPSPINELFLAGDMASSQGRRAVFKKVTLELESELSRFKPEVTSLATQLGAKLFLVCRVYSATNTATGESKVTVTFEPVGIANSLEHAILRDMRGTNAVRELYRTSPIVPKTIRKWGVDASIVFGAYVEIDLISENGLRTVTATIEEDAVSVFNAALRKSRALSKISPATSHLQSSFLQGLQRRYLEVRTLPIEISDSENASVLASLYQRNMTSLMRISALEKTYKEARSRAESSSFLRVLTTGLGLVGEIYEDQQRANAERQLQKMEGTFTVFSEELSELRTAIQNSTSRVNEVERKLRERGTSLGNAEKSLLDILSDSQSLHGFRDQVERQHDAAVKQVKNWLQ